MPRNYDTWAEEDLYNRELEHEKAMETYPICSECGEPIQDDYVFDFGEGLLCSDCADMWVREHRHSLDEYIED